MICGRRQNFLQRSAAILQQETGKPCKWYVCDVRDPDACHKAVQYALDEFGRLDIVVNGAAGNFLASAKDLKPKGFATVMNIDAIGTFNMSSAAFPALMQRNNEARDPIIINISATLQCPATHWQAHASAAKAAVDSLTRSLALEWVRILIFYVFGHFRFFKIFFLVCFSEFFFLILHILMERVNTTFVLLELHLGRLKILLVQQN